MQKTTVPYLLLNALIFTLIGATVMVAPTQFARALDITVESATATSDFRAVYGGVCFAIAAFAISALRREALRPAAVLALVLIFDGLIFGRLLTWVTHGPGSALIFAQLALEVGGAAWGALVLRAASPRRLASA